MKKIIILIPLMLFLLVGMIAYSQEPTPTPLKFSMAEQNKPPIQYKNTENKQYNAANSSVNVNEVKAVSTDQKEKYQTNSNNYETPIKWTDWLIVFFTGILAISTICLWWSTNKLWKTSVKTIDLTKQEFIASHPPKLRVHSVSLRFYRETGKEWKIQCAITNIGGTPATIKESNLMFDKLNKIENQLPVVLPFSDQDHMLSEAPIAPGEYIIGELVLSDQIRTALDIEMWQGTRSDNEKPLFYFFGYLNYLDDAGITRKTAFCRGYNIEDYRFTAVEGDDYEYSY
jgi:hypothetical protein